MQHDGGNLVILWMGGAFPSAVGAKIGGMSPPSIEDRRSWHEARRELTPEEAQRMRSRYVDDLANLDQLREEFGWSKQAIARRLRKLGVELRPPGPAPQAQRDETLCDSCGDPTQAEPREHDPEHAPRRRYRLCAPCLQAIKEADRLKQLRAGRAEWREKVAKLL